MGFLSDEELKKLLPAETAAFPAPIPTQSVSSDEFMPAPQTEKQREFEARIKELRRRAGAQTRHDPARFFQDRRRHGGGLRRHERHLRRALRRRAEPRPPYPEMAAERAKALTNQFVMDMHTHFLRDDTRIRTSCASARPSARPAGTRRWQGKPQTIDDLKFANYFKEMFLDSDTKVACISGSPSEEPRDWFLTNQMKFDARAKVNKEAGTNACSPTRS